jgi:hypothetical protein
MTERLKEAGTLCLPIFLSLTLSMEPVNLPSSEAAILPSVDPVKLIPKAGFVDIIEHVYKWPIGPWSSDDRLKEIGRWTQRFWLDGIDSWVLALFTRQLGVCDPASYSFLFLSFAYPSFSSSSPPSLSGFTLTRTVVGRPRARVDR